MPDQHPNGGYTIVPLEAEGYAATVEAVAEMVQATIVGPVATVTLTFTRGEARDVALALIDGSQQIEPEED